MQTMLAGMRVAAARREGRGETAFAEVGVVNAYFLETVT